MKKFLLTMLTMAVFATASAQFSFGGLAKQMKKAAKQQVEAKINETVNSAIVGVNPFKDVWRIDSIKAVGVRTSENFGKVWLVIYAEAIVPLKYGNVQLGGTSHQCYAVVDGKTYKPYEFIEEKFELPEGVPMEINTQGKGAVEIKDVPASATEIKAYNMYIYIDPSRHQNVLWKNIPISWME